MRAGADDGGRRLRTGMASAYSSASRSRSGSLRRRSTSSRASSSTATRWISTSTTLSEASTPYVPLSLLTHTQLTPLSASPDQRQAHQLARRTHYLQHRQHPLDRRPPLGGRDLGPHRRRQYGRSGRSSLPEYVDVHPGTQGWLESRWGGGGGVSCQVRGGRCGGTVAEVAGGVIGSFFEGRFLVDLRVASRGGV